MNHQSLSMNHSKDADCCHADAPGVNSGAVLTHEPSEGGQSVLLSIAGMHCGACAGRIQEALIKMNGVTSARVIFADSEAEVHFDPGQTDITAIISTVAAAGYEAERAAEKTKEKDHHQRAVKAGAKPFILGGAATLGTIGFYLGLLTLTSDWYNAKAQFGDYRWWVLSLAAGLGLQVGLFVHLRAFIARTHINRLLKN